MTAFPDFLFHIWCRRGYRSKPRISDRVSRYRNRHKIAHSGQCHRFGIYGRQMGFGYQKGSLLRRFRRLCCANAALMSQAAMSFRGAGPHGSNPSQFELVSIRKTGVTVHLCHSSFEFLRGRCTTWSRRVPVTDIYPLTVLTIEPSNCRLIARACRAILCAHVCPCIRAIEFCGTQVHFQIRRCSRVDLCPLAISEHCGYRRLRAACGFGLSSSRRNRGRSCGCLRSCGHGRLDRCIGGS